MKAPHKMSTHSQLSFAITTSLVVPIPDARNAIPPEMERPGYCALERHGTVNIGTIRLSAIHDVACGKHAITRAVAVAAGVPSRDQAVLRNV